MDHVTTKSGNDPHVLPHRRGGRSRRVVIATILALAGLGGIGGAAGLFHSGPSGLTDAPLPPDHGAAHRMSFKITTTSSGRLEARRQIEIRSKLDTRSNIVELVPEGKAVKAGDLLIRLNTDEIEQAIREEQLAVETARAEAVAADNGLEIQINENESKLRQAESKLKLADLALQQWEQGDVKKKKQELELAIEKTSSDLTRLTEKVATSMKLKEQGFLSKDELEQDKIALTGAKSAAKSAELDHEIYWNYKHPEEKETKSSALKEATSELERVRMNNQIELVSKESSKTTRRKQLEIHEERLKELQKQVAEASITAPVDGLVVYAFSMGLGWRETPLQIGQPVYPNELVMILPDTSEMTAGIGVHESLAGRVKEGQAVDVKVDAAGRTFRGTVESLGVIAESGDRRDQETREYKVKVALDAAAIKGVELKPSMRVDATITLGEVTDALALPIQAIFNEGPLRFVYERRGGSFVRTPVTVGRMSSNFAEITGGLPEGTVVLLREPHGGEFEPRAWDPAALAAVNMELDPEGRPVARAAPTPTADPGPTALCLPAETLPPEAAQPPTAPAVPTPAPG